MFEKFEDTLKKIVTTLFLVFILTGCGEQTVNEVSEEILNSNTGDSLQNFGNVVLSGKAIKGVIENANVSVYLIKNGQINSELLATAHTDINGEFSVKIPRKHARRLLYLELTASNSELSPTTMTCDAYAGCGQINGETIQFGDSFPLNNNFLLRNVVKLEGHEEFMPAHFSPLRHMVVAQVEAAADGFTWSNVDAAGNQVAQLFSLQTPIHKLTPVDLTGDVETLYLASDEEIIAAIIDASFLNIGESPNYKSVEQVLNDITQQQGVLEEEQGAISASEVMLAASSNVPTTLTQRSSVANYFGVEGDGGEENPTQYSLSLGVSGSGNVSNSDSSVYCGASLCAYDLVENTSLSLTATAVQGHEFDRWEGACSASTSNTCVVSINTDSQVTAVFKEIVIVEPTYYSLNIGISGSGAVNNTENNINCSNDGCVKMLEEGSSLALNALPSAGFEFDRWEVQCIGSTSPSCALTMSNNLSVIAVFKEIVQEPSYVSLNMSVSGAGSIQNTEHNINCSNGSCEKMIEEGSSLALSALPAAGYEFDRWEVQCIGSASPSCALTMNNNLAVIAVFKEKAVYFSLDMNVVGNGTVQNILNNITCSSATCSQELLQGTNLTLMATPAEGYEFDHWELSCNNSTSSECSVAMSGDIVVKAIFAEAAAQIGVINVNWSAPTEREDGTALASSEIKQYTIYYRESQDQPYAGATSKIVADDGSGNVPTSLTIEGLEKGKSYYLAGVTIDTNGLTSQLSNEIIKAVQ
jgi:hypothetical protein